MGEMMKDRTAAKAKAHAEGYFWAACPLCGEYYAGFECGSPGIDHDDQSGSTICSRPTCVAESKRRRAAGKCEQIAWRPVDARQLEIGRKSVPGTVERFGIGRQVTAEVWRWEGRDDWSWSAIDPAGDYHEDPLGTFATVEEAKAHALRHVHGYMFTNVLAIDCKKIHEICNAVGIPYGNVKHAYSASERVRMLAKRADERADRPKLLRPDWESWWARMNSISSHGAVCSCGGVLRTQGDGREHWQLGHFDYVDAEHKGTWK